MTKLRLLLIAGSLACNLIPGYANAEFYSGNNLLLDCNAQKSEPNHYQQGARCLAYVLGAHDGLEIYQAFTMTRIFCVPAKVTAEQMRDIVIAHLRNNPARRHHGAVNAESKALMDAFPCPSGS